MGMNENDKTLGIVTDICNRFGLAIARQLTLGNICKSIYKVTDKSRRQLVLKVGQTERAIAEIRMNRRGYEKMDAHKLMFFRPAIMAHEDTGDYAMILMEFCGDDFFTQIKKSATPADLYRKLSLEIEMVYRRSLGAGPEGKDMILSVIEKIKEQYRKYIFANLDPEGTIADRIDQLGTLIDTKGIDTRCFSNWDFTPEDVYLTPNGLKYSDPHEDILGVPIVDLACFSGVALTHQLPGAQEGYDILKNLAIKKVSALLEIKEKEAQKIFCLGRLLQCFLSARFRITSDPKKAKAAFKKSKSFLEKIVRSC